MATELEKLKNLLAELFQLDAADDLDFGMYRVLRLRREELTAFLENTLASEVKRAMGSVADKEREAVASRMRQIEEQAAQFNASAEGNAEYVKLWAKLAEATDATARERQVYAHLAEFFSRYYEDGDFLSLPRMKAGTYAIPYDGSEVVLHWANKDQYYVKSGEYFARYAFQLGDGRRVVFRLVDAQVDPDNMKSADAGKRRVILAEPDGVKLENGELVCRFVFAATEGKQDAVNVVTEKRVSEAAPPGWTAELAAEKPGQTSKEKYTTLGWHLRQYVEKNKRDYFIHKDLGGFLRREIDHYLKTEVFDLDSVEAMNGDDVDRAVTMVKTVRAVAKPIITFLASVEDFQKRLFLKKKMVLRTDWCVTLDRVPEEFYAEIAANKAQVARWKELFAIDTIPPVLGDGATGETVSAEFLKRNRGLVVETRLFGASLTGCLLQHFSPDVAGKSTAELVRGENLQWLRLASSSLAGDVDLIYLDPPYNTGSDGFAYKDGYQHSTWLAMLRDRLAACARHVDGFLAVSIDDRECASLQHLLRASVPELQLVSDIGVVNNMKGRQDREHIATAHEHLLLLAAAGASSNGFPLTDEQRKAYASDGEGEEAYQLRDLRKRGGADTQVARPKLHFAIFRRPDGTHGMERSSEEDREIFPMKSDGTKGCWRWGRERVAANLADLSSAEARDSGRWNVSYRVYLSSEGRERTVKPKSFWIGPQYSTDAGGKVLSGLLTDHQFEAPKAVGFLRDVVRHCGGDEALVVDFFAGSGTTGHAVVTLNREDGGNRKFILVEVNEYFDTILLPRILKATYSKDWKDGKPVDRTPVPGGALYKVMYLESYEDTLANITLPPPPSDNPIPFHLRREYTIRYMLDNETRQAVLDLDRFRKPFDWTMEVRRGGLVTKEHPVDLVETFNYLIGLHVSRYGFFREAHRIRYVEGTVKEDGNDRRVLVLWRDCDLVPDDELVRLFDDREFAPVSSREYDRIYVNGDPPLANIKRQDEQWKVLAIEDEFKRLSFADDEA